METNALAARLERLLTRSKRVIGEDDINRGYTALLEVIVEFVGADQGFVVLRDAQGQPKVRAAHNLDRMTVRGDRFRPYRKIADLVLRHGEPFLSAAIGDDTRADIDASLHDLSRTVLVLPLRASQIVIGAVYCDKFHDGTQPFQVDDLRVAQEFGDLAASILELRQANLTLREQASELRRAKIALEMNNTSLQEHVAAKSVELEKFERVLDSRNRALGLKYAFNNIIGRGPQMQRIFSVLSQVMDYPVPVLVTGESGTGKELIARALHHGGPRASEPFMAINCAAIPDNLLESELFGYKRGAFTGANADKEGLFRAARAGTVFLDEIGEMPMSVQAKLLRVLQEREVQPIGGREPEPVNARIVAATNRDLLAEVRAGRFREDLYYRLNVVEVRVPPLRERVEDIPVLTEHFLTRFSAEIGLPPKQLDRAALHRLMQLDWPGNVRQLENVIKSSAILSRGETIRASEIRLSSNEPTPASPEPSTSVELPSTSPASSQGIRSRAEWDAHEKQRLLDALVTCGWNKTRAAEHLGVSRRNLYRKLSRFGIEGER